MKDVTTKRAKNYDLVNKSNGITLISLVITIIVLLVLSGITIFALIGENGLLKKVESSKIESEIANHKEQIELAIMASKVNEDGSINKEILKEELRKIDKAELEEASSEQELIKVIFEDRIFKINLDGRVIEEKEDTIEIEPGQIAEDSNKKYYNNGKAIIPEGFCIVPGCDDISKGLVISDNNEDTEINSGNIIANGNQFVWVPVKKDKFESYIELDKDTDNDNASNYENIINSVLKYEGFYVGRFEAGKVNEEVVVRKNTVIYSPTLDNRFSTDYGYAGNSIGVPYASGVLKSPLYLFDELQQPIVGADELAEKFCLNKTYSNSVFSSLTYGSTYQATLDFFVDWDYERKEEILNNISVGGTQVGTIKTGRDESRKIKNIYDFHGNIAEWMKNVSSDIYIYGGTINYYNNKDVKLLNPIICKFAKSTTYVYADANLGNIQTSDGEKFIVGFRPCLFIKV